MTDRMGDWLAHGLGHPHREPAEPQVGEPVSDATDPWRLHTGPMDLRRLAVTESLFALSNGHIGLRGSLDEGEPKVRSGTYINGFYEERPLPHPEAGYGFPESGQTV